MAKLLDVITQLKKNEASTDRTSDSVRELAQIMQDQWNLEALDRSAQRMADIEYQRELITTVARGGGRGGPGPTPPPTPPPSSGGMFGGFTDMIKNFSSGLLSLGGKFLAPSLTLLTEAFSLISAPLMRIGKLFLRGGAVGLVIFTLYEIFKDIGENPMFMETITHIQEVWNTKILPTFAALQAALDSIGNSELGTFLGSFFENMRLKIQDFVLRNVNILVDMFSDIFLGITQIFQGDFATGINTIIDGLTTAVFKSFDSLLTLILGVFGIEFGEGGTLFGAIDIAITNLTTWISTKWTEFTTWITTAWDGFINFFIGEDGWVMTHIAMLRTAVSETWASLTKYISDTFATVGTYIIEKWDNFVKILTVDFPAKIEEWKMFALEKIQGMREVVGGFIQTIMDGFTNAKDFLVSTITFGITKVVDEFKIAFAAIGAFIANIPDQLYLMISKNLRFSLPEIKIPIPDWLGGGDFTLLSGFDVGVGDEATQAAAQGRIETRNTNRDDTIKKLNEDISAKMKEMNDAYAKLKSTGSAPIIVVQDNSASASTQNNSGAMVKLDQGLPSSNMAWALRNGRLPQL